MSGFLGSLGGLLGAVNAGNYVNVTTSASANTVSYNTLYYEYDQQRQALIQQMFGQQQLSQQPATPAAKAEEDEIAWLCRRVAEVCWKN